MNDKGDLYGKVKWVKGENFITMEETKRLSPKEMLEMIELVAEDTELKKVRHLTILLDSSFPSDVERSLERHQFALHDQTVVVRRDLMDIKDLPEWFELKSLREISEEQFIKIWAATMEGSLNAASYLDMDEQMKSVKKEIGSSYIDTCNIAFEDDDPIGVVMPHIEQGTDDEGRLFYFGLVPEARGKGKSVPLHYQSLQKLKEYFGATYNIGGTSIKNQPMLQVFERNGCEIIERIKVYKRSL